MGRNARRNAGMKERRKGRRVCKEKYTECYEADPLALLSQSVEGGGIHE
jgi:hypothetical protein